MLRPGWLRSVTARRLPRQPSVVVLERRAQSGPGRGAAGRVGSRADPSAAHTSSADSPWTSRRATTVRCRSGRPVSARRHLPAHLAGHGRVLRRSGCHGPRAAHRRPVAAATRPRRRGNGAGRRSGPARPSRREDHGTVRASRTPRVLPRLARMRNTQVRSDDRPRSGPGPVTTRQPGLLHDLLGGGVGGHEGPGDPQQRRRPRVDDARERRLVAAAQPVPAGLRRLAPVGLPPVERRLPAGVVPAWWCRDVRAAAGSSAGPVLLPSPDDAHYRGAAAGTVTRRGGSRGRPAPPPAARRSAWEMAQAALTRPMWLNACGKLPSSSPVCRVDLLGEQPDVVDEARRPARTPRAARSTWPDRASAWASQKVHSRNVPSSPASPSTPSVGAVAVDQPAVVGQPLPRSRRSWPASAGRRPAGTRRSPSSGWTRPAPSTPNVLGEGAGLLAPAVADDRRARSRRGRASTPAPGPAAPSRSARAIARSSATQHITLE